jgi:hypothetical protein
VKRIARAASNEWNVPDWKDESQYPIPLPEKDDSDLFQWRWEFLRRDKEYRQDWLRIRAKDPEGKLTSLDHPSESDILSEIPVLVVEQYKNPFYFQKKYKLKKLLNPALRKPRHLAFYPYPSGNSITMKLSLDLPRAYQMQRTNEALKQFEKNITGKISRATLPQKKNWPLYLRAIDAQDRDNLSLPEIGYQVLGYEREKYDPHHVKSLASSFLAIGRRFWKKLRIPPDKA